MRKKTSRRRWKARALLGVAIPLEAIENHRLGKWRRWVSVSYLTHYYYAFDN